MPAEACFFSGNFENVDSSGATRDFFLKSCCGVGYTKMDTTNTHRHTDRYIWTQTDPDKQTHNWGCGFLCQMACVPVLMLCDLGCITSFTPLFLSVEWVDSNTCFRR